MRHFHWLWMFVVLLGCVGQSARTIGPYESLQDAQQAVRAIQKQGLNEPLIVRVSGNTSLSTPLVFDSSDSGTEQNPISYVADENAGVISGGKRITGWYLTSGQVWAANVGSFTFRQLFVNGKRMIPARTPNQGSFFNVDGYVDYNEPVNFKYRPGQMSSNWVGAEIVLLQTWGESRLPITAVDPSSQTVTLANRLPPWMLENDARYWVEGSAEFLDQPGEWFLDRDSGVVYYFANKDEDVRNEEIIAPTTSALLELNGARNINFTNFTFQYSDWHLPADGYRDVQTAFDVPGAISGEGISSIGISSSHFEHLGTWAITLDKDSTNNTISDNQMNDLGAGGVKIGENCTDAVSNTNSALAGFENCDWGKPFSSGNQINGNTIHDIGNVYIAAAGIWLGQTYSNKVCSNEVYDTNQTGISVGWTWGYGLTVAHDNLIAFNKVHSIGRGMLSDMGGIYTLGVQPGTVIRNNLIHDVSAYLYGGWGIYQDAGSSRIVTQNNLVYLAHSGGFIHYADGDGNQVINNIFALGDSGQVITNPDFVPIPPTAGYIVLFKRNIFYGNGLFSGFGLVDNYLRFDGNLYDNLGSPQTIDDPHAIINDPQFIAPADGDFALRPTSPAYRMSFEPLQLSTSHGPCN